MIAYLLLFAAMLLGFLAAPSWTLLLPALGLSALSVQRLLPLRQRFDRIGRQDVFGWAVAAAMGENVLFAAGAFALGRVIRYLLVT